MHSSTCVFVGCLALSIHANAAAQELLLPSPLERDTVIALAVERNPNVRATKERARAADRRADAEGKLPSPEAGLEVWQIPFSDRQGMVMVSLRQRFPALGISLGSRSDALRADARAIDVQASDTEREIRRRAAHAFADYFEAAERVHLHAAHIDLGNRIVAASRARAESGGSIADVAQAEVDLAMIKVEHQEARVRREGARVELDALLVRPIDAALPDPIVPPATAPAWTVARIVDEARSRRPEIDLARARADADEARRSAAKREWIVPSLSLGALYFAPVGPTNQNGVGVSVALEIPWLWGAAKAYSDAAALDAEASKVRIDGTRIDVAAEVAGAYREAAAASLRVRSYDELVIPASKKALDIAFAGYASSRTDLPILLLASRAVVDAELARLVSAAALEHALAELDAAAGFAVPRQPLSQWSMP